MQLDLIADIAALGALILLLVWLRRRHRDQRVGLWIAGLVLIFAETVAHLVTMIPGPWHELSHALELTFYAIAAIVFIWGAFPARNGTSRQRLLLWASGPPLLFLLGLYSYGVDRPDLYYWTIAVALGTGLWTILGLRLHRRYILLRVAIVSAMALCVRDGDLRLTVYLALAYAYALCAWSFWQTLPRGSIGRVVIVTGFSLWSLCFLTHSTVLHHRYFLPLAEEVWSLQPFAVTLGMLLVMYEDQVDRNKHLALHDPLTSLPNRRLLEDRLRQAALQAQRTGSRVALLMLDLDGFKAINDSFGHGLGDALLAEIAGRLRHTLRSYNTLARVGGDEFAIVSPDLVPFPGQARFAVEAIQANIQQTLAQPIELDGRSFRVGCSIGAAIFPDDTTEIDRLQHLADLRMYENKRARKQELAGDLPQVQPSPVG